jgi:hypothetical protein
MVSEQKRLRVLSPSAFSAGSLEDSELSTYETSSNGSRSPSNVTIDDRHSPLLLKSNPYAFHQYQHMLGSSRQWINFMMPYINHSAESPASCNDRNSISPSTSPSKSISFSDNENASKKSNFSIASILGL